MAFHPYYEANHTIPSGWVINISKSETTPIQRLQFIALFNTNLGKMFVPPDRWLEIRKLVPLALRQSLHLWPWQQLPGLLRSAQTLTQRSQLHVCPIQTFLTLPYSYRTAAALSWSISRHHFINMSCCGGRVSLRPFMPTHHGLGSSPCRSTDCRVFVQRRPKTAYQQPWIQGSGSGNISLGGSTMSIAAKDWVWQQIRSSVYQQDGLNLVSVSADYHNSVLPTNGLTWYSDSSLEHSRDPIADALSDGMASSSKDFSMNLPAYADSDIWKTLHNPVQHTVAEIHIACLRSTDMGSCNTSDCVWSCSCGWQEVGSPSWWT